MLKAPIKPRQSLGQNFLIDQNVARKIVSALDLQESDHVLEIGPGLGMITMLIQPRVERLIAVEIDRNLIPVLRENLSNCQNFTLIEADFLRIDLTEFLQTPLRIIGNIPYHITSPILFKVLRQRKGIRDMTLLVQKEVAERIVASPFCKEYGILSVMSQAYADVKILLRVPRTVFSPRPKVDSALVRWTFHDRRSQHIKDEEFFRIVVRRAFGQRRKMLRNSLKELLPPNRTLSIDLQKRPEQITIDQWILLANELATTENDPDEKV